MKELYKHINSGNFQPSKEILEAYFKEQLTDKEGWEIEEWFSSNEIGDEVGDLYSSELKNNINWGYASGDLKELYKKINSNTQGFDINQYLAVFVSSIIILSILVGSNLYDSRSTKKIDMINVNPNLQINDDWVINEYMVPALDVTDSIDKAAIKETYKEYKDSPISLFGADNHSKNKKEVSVLDVNSSSQEERLERKLVIKPMINDTSIFFSRKKLTVIYNQPIKYILNFKCIDYNHEYNKLKPVLSGLEPQFEPHKLRTESYPNMTEPVVISFSVEEIMEEAFEAFTLRDYGSAIQKLNLILDHYPNDLNARFYKGLCYYETGRYEKCISFLQLVAKDDINVFKEEAHWYLTKSYYKMGEIYIATDLLHNILDSEGFYKENAEKLLRDINMNK